MGAVRVYVVIELSTEMICFKQAVEKFVRDAYLPRDGTFSRSFKVYLKSRISNIL